MAYFEDGSESEFLDAQCRVCLFQTTRCPIYMVQGLYNYDQMTEGQDNLKNCLTFLVDDSGKCRIKELLNALCRDIEECSLLQQLGIILSASKKKTIA